MQKSRWMAAGEKRSGDLDPLNKEQRRRNMQAIRSKDTSIEIILRKALWKQGIRYRKNYKKIIGKPDIALTKYKIAIFCDSEFWHGFEWEIKKAKITVNKQYWVDKIERNMARDLEINQKLSQDGWIVLRFWGKYIKKNPETCVQTVINTINKIENEVKT